MRVVIAEDEVLLREGLGHVLAGDGFEVVAAVGTAAQLEREVARHVPDLAITDIRMPPGYTDEGLVAALRLSGWRGLQIARQPILWSLHLGYALLALGLGRSHGQLAAGCVADFVAWDLDHPRELAYWFGRNPCRRVIRGGIETLLRDLP